jgi:hypothetical protein
LHRRRKVICLPRHGNVNGNEHLYPSLHQSIDQTSQDLRMRVRRSCFLPTAISTVLGYSALRTAENILHAALACNYRTVSSSLAVHLASSETLLVRMPSQIQLQTVKIRVAASSRNLHSPIQSCARRKWSGISAVGVQAVSATSRKYALPLLFSVASSSETNHRAIAELTVDHQKGSL